MSDFTIEQLEALKENTTPGKWEINPLSGNVASFGHGEIAGTLSCPSDRELIMAAPALVDALIAEKRKHDELRQEIGSLIGKLETKAENAHSNLAYISSVALRETTRDLTRILEATND